MADINTYALGLELQLQSKQAFDILDQLEQRLGNIEKKAASIAPSAMATKEQQQYNEATALGATETQILDDTLQRFQQALVETQKMYDDGAAGVRALIIDQEELREALELRYQQNEKLLRQFNRMELQGIKLSDQDKAKIKEIQALQDKHEDMKDATMLFFRAQEKLRKENEQHLSVLDNFGKVGTFVKQALLGMKGETIALSFSLGILFQAFNSLSEMMEAYSLTSFRLLGTQGDLITATNELRSSLGATTEEGIKTLTGLSHAGFKATDEIGELAKANYMFSKSSGVSSDIAADFQRRIVAMGFSATQATEGLATMSNIIRQSGLSAQEAQTLLTGLTQSMRALHFFYGSDATLKATKDMAGFIGAIKEAGGDVGAVTSQLNEMAKSPIKTRIAFGMVHADIVKGVPQWGDYFSKVSKKMGELNARAEQTGDTLSGEAMIKALHISAEQADSYLLLWQRAGKTEEGFKKLLATGQENADMTRDFNESMATFRKSLQRILQPLMAIGTALLDSVGPGIIAMLKPLAMFTTAIAKVLEFLFKIPVAGALVKATLGLFLVMPIVNKLKAWTDSFAKVKTAASGFMNAFKGITKVAPFLSQAFGPISKVLAPALSKSTALFKQVGAAAEEAGGGFMGWSKGIGSVALNLAKAHPLIAAVVVSIGAALLIVPRLFEMMDSTNESIQALGIVLTALLAPLVVFYVQIRMAWEVLKALWDVLAPIVMELLKPAIDAFKQLAGSTGKSMGVMKTLNVVMEKFGNIVRGVFKFLIPIAKFLFIAFQPILWIFKALTGSFNPLVGIFKVVGAGASFLKSLMASIWDFFKPIVDKLKWAYDMLPDWMKASKKTEEAAKNVAAIGKRQREIWSPQHEKNALRAHKTISHVVDKTKELAKPELTRAVKPAFMDQHRANPVAHRVQPAQRGMTIAEKKTLDAHAKLHTAVTNMHNAIEDTSANQDKMEKLLKLLEMYLPQIAEDQGKGLSGAANSWT